MYRDADYVNVVGNCAKESMAKVARGVKDLPNYASEGEVCESVLVGFVYLVRVDSCHILNS